jgi:hypothetical protein
LMVAHLDEQSAVGSRMGVSVAVRVVACRLRVSMGMVM